VCGHYSSHLQIDFSGHIAYFLYKNNK